MALKTWAQTPAPSSFFSCSHQQAPWPAERTDLITWAFPQKLRQRIRKNRPEERRGRPRKPHCLSQGIKMDHWPNFGDRWREGPQMVYSFWCKFCTCLSTIDLSQIDRMMPHGFSSGCRLVSRPLNPLLSSREGGRLRAQLAASYHRVLRSTTRLGVGFFSQAAVLRTFLIVWDRNLRAQFNQMQRQVTEIGPHSYHHDKLSAENERCAALRRLQATPRCSQESYGPRLHGLPSRLTQRSPRDS